MRGFGAAAVLLVLAGCGGEPGLPKDAIDYSQPVAITFEADGTADSVNIVLTAGDKRTELNDRAVPFGRYRDRTTSDNLNEPAEFEGPVSLDVSALEPVSIRATIGSGGGEIECRLLAGDVVLDTAVASGPFATATCEGRAPAPIE